jgi:hypothetical protein
VSITDFKITQLDKQTAQKTLNAEFTLMAYYADPNAMAPKPAPGAPGAAQPAAVPPPAAK